LDNAMLLLPFCGFFTSTAVSNLGLSSLHSPSVQSRQSYSKLSIFGAHSSLAVIVDV
jgi:hypothetical protein